MEFNIERLPSDRDVTKDDENFNIGKHNKYGFKYVCGLYPQELTNIIEKILDDSYKKQALSKSLLV